MYMRFLDSNLHFKNFAQSKYVFPLNSVPMIDMVYIKEILIKKVKQ